MKRRIAHISDLHFGKLSFGLTQLFSKRWIGMMNLLLSRRKHYLNSRPTTLFDAFEAHGITDVILAGDLTTTSFVKEYDMAKRFVDTLSEMNIKTYVIPGNHDHYTRRSFRQKLFYNYFPDKYDENCPFSLRKDGITFFHFEQDWYIVLMDTAIATSFYHSIGYYSKLVEDNLKKALTSLPDSARVILVNHFPFFQHESPRRRLKRGGELQSLIRREPKIHMYLHGHTHRHTLADLRENGLPLVMDSGSASHKSHGTWNLLELSAHQCMVQVYSYDKNANHEWKATHQKLYTW